MDLIKIHNSSKFVIRMAKSRQQKAATKEKLVKLFKDSSSVVFADYQGLNVPQADELRNKMYEGKVTYMVAKKSLINLSAKEAGVDVDAKQYPGMIGIAFGSDDEIAPAKILGDMSKKSSIKLVGGIFGGKAVTQDYVITLSTLPSRNQLYGMFLSVINGPLSGFVRALDAIRKQKEADMPKAEVSAVKTPAMEAEAAPATEHAPQTKDAESAKAPAEELKPAEDTATEPAAETAPESTPEPPKE